MTDDPADVTTDTAFSGRPFYGVEQARIHHERFGKLAAVAAEDLLARLAAAGHHEGTVVDLGCGSGILARAVTAAGYRVVGVDISPDMVALAHATAPAADLQVGSAYDIDLPGPCVAVTAIGEVLNYLADRTADDDRLAALATRVHGALTPGGVFLFDVSGPGRAGEARRVSQFHLDQSWCLGMVATESDDGAVLDREISIFTAQPDGHYRRVDEHHVLRLYRRDELAALLSDVGFEVSIEDDYRLARHYAPIPAWYVVEARRP